MLSAAIVLQSPNEVIIVPLLHLLMAPLYLSVIIGEMVEYGEHYDAVPLDSDLFSFQSRYSAILYHYNPVYIACYVIAGNGLALHGKLVGHRSGASVPINSHLVVLYCFITVSILFISLR